MGLQIKYGTHGLVERAASGENKVISKSNQLQTAQSKVGFAQ